MYEAVFGEVTTMYEKETDLGALGALQEGLEVGRGAGEVGVDE